MSSPFAAFQADAYPYTFHASLHVDTIAGGTPADPKVVEAWLGAKLKEKDRTDFIRQEADAIRAEIVFASGVPAQGEAAAVFEEASKQAQAALAERHLVRFRRTEDGLYIGGRQLKAAIKEAAVVARGADKLKPKYGKTGKGVYGFFAEHVFVVQDRVFLRRADGSAVTEADTVEQSFPLNKITNQRGIQYTELVEDVYLDFEVIADHPFSRREWAMLWLTGEQQGIGATRSQGFGRYQMVRWEPSAAAAKAMDQAEHEDDAQEQEEVVIAATRRSRAAG